MSKYPLLDICARIEGHKAQHKLLREYCHDLDDWEALLQEAELEGMAPLLKKHLAESGSSCPVTAKRSLNILAKRHQRQSEVRVTVLREILALFHREQFTPIIIKGAALCHTIYPDPALRPMRDMDILLPTNEVDAAQEILRNTGFAQSKAPIPSDHYHLPSLVKIVDDISICIELHRGLYPTCPPYYPDVDFEDLLKTAKRFRINGTEALTFDDEEMLHYLYQHAFRAPLTYEKYKLINAADIIGFTEMNNKTLDWEKIRWDYPLLYNALLLMHHVSPWDFDKTPNEFVSAGNPKQKLEPKPFKGWPYKRRKEIKGEGRKVYRILIDTFLPSRWWLKIYYGAATQHGYFSCLLLKHPCHIIWWAKLYGYLKRTHH